VTVLIALIDELMDRSRVAAAIPAMHFARSAAAGLQQLGEVSPDDHVICVIDAARHRAALRDLCAAAPAGSRVVVYGPHVDAEAKQIALDAGATVFLARSEFFRDINAAVFGSAKLH
jgi:hypothetical protein